jgi:hypothetical protein
MHASVSVFFGNPSVIPFHDFLVTWFGGRTIESFNSCLVAMSGVNHGTWLTFFGICKSRDPSRRKLMMVRECTGTCEVPFVSGSACLGS